MTKMNQLKELEHLGVDFAGLIFYGKSPRCVHKGDINPAALKKGGRKINLVGVFVNEEPDDVLRAVDEWNLDVVQLHGDESPRYCEMISNHVHCIKAFRIAKQDRVDYKVYPYSEAVDLYLFDTFSKEYGGTGVQFEWDVLKGGSWAKPYFLSGGIGPNDASQLIDFASAEQNLFAIDVNSKFETAPGLKDMKLIETFIKVVNR
jgi:phosphoribosylanthranilate isomerase